MNSANDILICSPYMCLVDKVVRETWPLVKRILGRIKIVFINDYLVELTQDS